jgi:hypothetical protein
MGFELSTEEVIIGRTEKILKNMVKKELVI